MEVPLIQFSLLFCFSFDCDGLFRHTESMDDEPRRRIRRRQGPPSQPRLTQLPILFPSHGAPNTYNFRPADGVTPGFQQMSVHYEDAWAADQRQYGSGFAGAIMLNTRVSRQ
jgi:hypothetical protein